MASTKEIRAATEAAVESGKPVWTGITVEDGNGQKLRSGEPLSDGLVAAKEAGASAILINCSWPESIHESMPIVASVGLPFGAYANGFTNIDALQPGGTVDGLKARIDLDPKTYASHAMQWIEHGATIVGGCCEVGPDHIAEMVTQIKLAGHNIVSPIQ